MENYLGIILIVVISLVVWAIIFRIGEKYGGITFISGVNKHKKITDAQNSNSIDKLLVEENWKTNPDLVKKAELEIKRKKYKNTYSNLLSEIRKIEKNEPIWVEKRKLEHAELNAKNRRTESDVRIELNIPENDNSIFNEEFKHFLELQKKINSDLLNLTLEEAELYETTEFQNWSKIYEKNQKNNFNLLIKHNSR